MKSPDWLAQMQARFGDAIRAPLDRSTGTLRATPALYGGALDDAVDRRGARAEDRMAIYNRQYWYRLFGVMQAAFPLTTRLLGHWRFNEHAAKFLAERPPSGWDLDRAPDGFEDFLSEDEAIVEAAHIDAAARSIARAPEVTPYRPSAEDGARLLDARLAPSPATAIVVEHRPLVELRNVLLSHPSDDESPLPMPPKLDRARWIALLREPNGIRAVPLDAREGELLDLLRRHTVRDALTQIERACTEEERADLPARTRTWLARSVERGMWIGLDFKAKRS